MHLQAFVHLFDEIIQDIYPPKEHLKYHNSLVYGSTFRISQSLFNFFW